MNKSDVRDLRRYLCSSSPTSSKNRLLDKFQKKICRTEIHMMKYVVSAAKLAKTECVRLAKYQRWDCRGILQAPKFSKDLRVGKYKHYTNSRLILVGRSGRFIGINNCFKDIHLTYVCPANSLPEGYIKPDGIHESCTHCVLHTVN